MSFPAPSHLPRLRLVPPCLGILRECAPPSVECNGSQHRPSASRTKRRLPREGGRGEAGAHSGRRTECAFSLTKHALVEELDSDLLVRTQMLSEKRIYDDVNRICNLELPALYRAEHKQSTGFCIGKHCARTVSILVKF